MNTQIGRILVITGLYQDFVIDLSDLRIKLRLLPEEIETSRLSRFHRRIKRLTARARLVSRQVVGVRPATFNDRFLAFFGLEKTTTIRVEGVSVHYFASLRPQRDPRKIKIQPGYTEASVVVFRDAHRWDHITLQAACVSAILEGKVVVVLGDRHQGETIPYLMAVSDEPQILNRPCTHVDREGQVCGEPASRWQWVNEDTPLPWVSFLQRVAAINDRIAAFLRRYLLKGLLRMDLPDQGFTDLLKSLVPTEKEEQRYWEPPSSVRNHGLLLEALVGDGAYQPRCRKHLYDPESDVIAHGTVRVVIGGPESQKSARLRLLQLRSARDLRKETLAVSTREPVSRAGEEFTPDAIKVESAEELLERHLEPWHQVVIIDEGTLMEDLGYRVREIADLRRDQASPPSGDLQGREVTVFGRPTNARGEPQPETVGLMREADVVEPSPAICAVCGREAMGSQYLLNGQPAPFFLTYGLRYMEEPIPADEDHPEIPGMRKELEPRCWSCKEVPLTPPQFELEEGMTPLITEFGQEVVKRLMARDILTWLLVGTTTYLVLTNLRLVIATIAATTLLRWGIKMGNLIGKKIRDPQTSMQERIDELILAELRKGSLSAWILVVVLLRVLGRIIIGLLFP